jgi:hypothetical protein
MTALLIKVLLFDRFLIDKHPCKSVRTRTDFITVSHIISWLSSHNNLIGECHILIGRTKGEPHIHGETWVIL